LPITVAEFEADTAFERYVLGRIASLLPDSDATKVIELGVVDANGVPTQGSLVHLSVTDGMGSTRNALTADDVRPLLFGAAWKILDLLVELVLEQARPTPKQPTRMTIDSKVDKAKNGDVKEQDPFRSRPELWDRVMRTYAATKELRHTLVHRGLLVDRSTGTISEASHQGTSSTGDLTADEQWAFCGIAKDMADAVIGAAPLTTRLADRIGWDLDRLVRQHGQPSLGAPASSGLIPVVVVRQGPYDTLRLDFRAVRALAAGHAHHDLEIHLPDGRILAGPLEDAPPGVSVLPTAPPPPWLAWK
jgi:hypothetical protein